MKLFGRKLRVAILALVLVLAMIPVGTLAAETGQTDGGNPYAGGDDTKTEQESTDPTAIDGEEDVAEPVILFTGYVHGNPDKDMGAAGLVAYRNAIDTTEYIETVDLGNFSAGTVLAYATEGEAMEKVMNMAGYTMAVPGKDEIGNRIASQSGKIGKGDTLEYLSLNLKASDGKSVFAASGIRTYGERKVAYIGITDPAALGTGDAEITELYASVQAEIDKVKAEGADTVVILGNMNGDSNPAMSAESLIANVSGADVMLNSEAGYAPGSITLKDKDDKTVILSRAGTGYDHFGVLTLGRDEITVRSVGSYSYRNIAVKDYVSELKNTYADALGKTIGTTCHQLNSVNSQGIRTVENRETNLGDLAADAYRAATGADVALVQAGELTGNVKLGEISYKDILDVISQGEYVSVYTISGFDLCDALEMSVRNYPSRNSRFLQISGVTFDVQETVMTSVEIDGSGNFGGVNGEYRITNVTVNGEELDLMKDYTVAATDSLLYGDSGYTMLSSGKLKDYDVIGDSMAVVRYITDDLSGEVAGAYSLSQNRLDSIKIVKQSEIDREIDAAVDEQTSDYEARIAELEKKVKDQEEIIAIKSMTIKAGNSYTYADGKNKVKVKWTPSENVEGIKYQIYKASSRTGTYKKIGTKTKSLYMINTGGFTKDRSYYYKVRAYKYIDGKYYYSDWSNITCRKIRY